MHLYCPRVASLAIDDLEGNPADVAGNNRTAFPQALSHHQTEPFSQRLLHHDVSGLLEGVHLMIAHAIQVREQVDVPVFAGAGPAVRSQYAQPSGSSLAIEATITN